VTADYYEPDEKARLIEHAKRRQLNFEKRYLAVGQSKSAAGEGRTIPRREAATVRSDQTRNHVKNGMAQPAQRRSGQKRFGSSGRIRTYNPSVNSRISRRSGKCKLLKQTRCSRVSILHFAWLATKVRTVPILPDGRIVFERGSRKLVA
jgi:hypothetical protein